jgi:hypothetical protein
MSHRSVLIFLACLLLPLVTCNSDNTEAQTAATSSVAAVQGQMYYVRTDGGSAKQCTGLVDAPYPGNGINQPCAWDHPFRARAIAKILAWSHARRAGKSNAIRFAKNW